MKQYLALTCSALARGVYGAAANGPAIVTVQLFEQGLHNTPKTLRQILQEQIDAIPADTYDAILLVYGICGAATLGLVARHTPLVITRAHDCITLYLGSKERYQQEFDASPGTYWYSQDYLERGTSGFGGLGAANAGVMEDLYKEYVEKYGQDNADYLMEAMGEWGAHYDRAAFIDTGMGENNPFEQIAREQAERRGWRYERVAGSRRLVNLLITGEWPDNEFLIVPPGWTTIQSGGDGLIKAVPLTESSS